MKGMKKPIHTTKDCIAPPMALPLTLMPSKDRKGPVPAGRRKMPKAKLAPTVPAAAPVIAESRKHPSRRCLLFSFSASAASRLASQLAADSLSSLAPARTSASPPRSARERVAMARTSLRARRPPAWIDPGTPTLRRPDSPVTSITQSPDGAESTSVSCLMHTFLCTINDPLSSADVDELQVFSPRAPPSPQMFRRFPPGLHHSPRAPSHLTS